MAKRKHKNANYQTSLQTTLKKTGTTCLNQYAYCPDKPRKVSNEEKAQIQQALGLTNEQTARVVNILAKYPAMDFGEIANALPVLNKQYNLALINAGCALSGANLAKMDAIDLTDIGKEELDHLAKNEIREHFRQRPDLESQFYYNLIPCFTKGTIQHIQKRLIQYEVTELDLQNLTMTVSLHDYVNTPDGFLAGIYGVVKIIPMPGKTTDDIYEQECRLEILEEHDFPEIYRKFSPKQLGWSDIEAKVWQHILITNSDNIAARQASANISVMGQLTQLFLTYVSVTNYIMSKHRAKVIGNQKAQKETAATKSPGSAPQKDRVTPERVTRHIGRIIIHSTTKPVRPSKSNIRRYYLESWERRGHVRHLKSGKQVYIKQSTYHRKALKGKPVPDTKQPAATIKVHSQQTQH